MLSNTLLKIKKILDDKFDLEEPLKKNILSFLKNYNKGSYIYAGVLKRKFQLSSKIIYTFLEELKKEKILKSYYELYCSKCSKTNGELYETFNQIPETFICENCEVELNGIENAVILYKVIVDD